MSDEMTEEQRVELKQLCDEARVPDKSGEKLSRAAAQEFIDDLRQQLKERGSQQ